MGADRGVFGEEDRITIVCMYNLCWYSHSYYGYCPNGCRKLCAYLGVCRYENAGVSKCGHLLLFRDKALEPKSNFFSEELKWYIHKYICLCVYVEVCVYINKYIYIVYRKGMR